MMPNGTVIGVVGGLLANVMARLVWEEWDGNTTS